MPDTADNGIVSITSRHSVEATLDKLKGILEAGGVKIFALIDHSGEAQRAGLQMRDTKLLIFGNPKGGTPLMLASPTVALDLPLKILIWEDGAGQVWITYNSVDFIRQRHNLPPDLMANIAVIDGLARKAGE